MNKIFACVMTCTITFLLFTSPNSILDAMVAGGEKAVNLCLILIAIYAVWMSILEFVSATKLDQKLAKLLSPINKKIVWKANARSRKPNCN